MSTNLNIASLYHGEGTRQLSTFSYTQLNDPERIMSFLTIDFIPNEEAHTITVEFPLMLSEMMSFRLLPEVLRGERDIKRLVMPLYSSSTPAIVKSFKKLLSLTNELFLYNRLKQVTIKNKQAGVAVYYIGPGIILDKDYSPLLFVTYTYTIKYIQQDCCTYLKDVFKPIAAIPSKINCYVRPKVYSEPSVYVHKGIRDYWCTPGFTCPITLYTIYPYSKKANDIDCKIDTIISEHINDFFHRILEPEHGVDRKIMNLCINEYLDAYADDMFHALYYDY